VSLSCVITQHNWNQIDDMVHTAIEMGASSLVLNRYLGHDLAGLAARPDQLWQAVDRVRVLRESGERVKLGNCLPFCFSSSHQTGCLAGQAFFTVDPWAQVRPCNHAPLICGNLLEQSVEEIWHSEGLTHWRNLLPEGCADCAVASLCRGGCRAQALIAGAEADPLMRSPLPAVSQKLPSPITIYERARPWGRFDRRAEEFGALLMSGNRLLALAPEMEDILTLLDGQTELRQIKASYGLPGLAVVASLYQNGMVELLT
jgi:radical SAM protein with 4Fe4S-binding SPASM domain